MAHLYRTKQSGVAFDHSASLAPDLFAVEELDRFGIASQVSQVAYDPVQGLVAVGTNATSFGPGQVYIFGGKRISAVFQLGANAVHYGASHGGTRGASVKALHFCADRLVCFDSKNDVSVFSLLEKKRLKAWTPPGTVTAIASDPTLDYVLLGMHHGEILAFDIERGVLVPFKLPNLWAQHNPMAKTQPIVTMAFHPRDIGTLLIGYLEGAVIYSFKQNKVLKFLQYEVPRGAPGGDGNPGSVNMLRKPRLTHAVWHPTGTFILTAHHDSSLVFWDSKDGRVILARTLYTTRIDQPGATPPTRSTRTPFVKVAWCANQDPDDTALLVAGGTDSPDEVLTLMEFGRTPNYTTATWNALTEHLEQPKRFKPLQTPPGVTLSDFCLIPRESPWFAGAHDPIAILGTLTTGEILSMSFPSGYMISPSNQLHVSMTFVHPFVNCLGITAVERTKWLGTTEDRTQGPTIAHGGTEAHLPLKRFADRSIIHTAHGDGSVRLWDVGHADEIENLAVNQADVSRAVGRGNVSVTQIAFSGASGELAVGLQSGEVAIFRWSRNRRPGLEPLPAGPNNSRILTDISDRKDPSLVEGFHPFTLFSSEDGRCSALKVSDVGFIAAGFEGGNLCVMDMRGPAVIFTGNIAQFTARERHGHLRRRSTLSQPSFVTALEFSVMTLEGEQYSSILLHGGTSQGHVFTLKILPEQNGRYTTQFAGVSALDGRVLRIHPLNSSSDLGASATQGAVAGLREGRRTEGALLAVTLSEARIFRPASGKGAHKSWDNLICDAAAVTRCRELGSALTCLFGDGTVRIYSIPGLRELGSAKVDHLIDVRRFAECLITPSGQLLGWKGPSELVMLTIWGSGESKAQNNDVLFNPTLQLPPRPTISNFQWVSGTQYITSMDMDVLIGGPDRPPSKRAQALAAADERTRRAAGLTGALPTATTGAGAGAGAGTGAGPQGAQEGYLEHMQRQITERTAKLGTLDDTMNDLGQTSAQWSKSVTDFVNKQKRNMVMGAVKSKFGI